MSIEDNHVKAKQERLTKLRSKLAECKDIPVVHAGSTDADYLFRERMNAVIGLFLDWLDFELAEQ